VDTQRDEINIGNSEQMHALLQRADFTAGIQTVWIGYNCNNNGPVGTCSLAIGLAARLAEGIAISVVVILLYVWWKRKETYRKLVQSGLPTVYWLPKFARYQLDHPKHLSSSSITNILPRMQRLNGPFSGGMYGTVYGVSTAVIHVAHPTPAMALLGATTLPSSQRALSSSSRGRKSSVSDNAVGTGKAPAYNHFANFSGQGVFTADGNDWRTKRAAVLHALLRSSSGTTSFYEHVEQETHRAATCLFRELDSQIALAEASGCFLSTNIVPILQRTTIGLIYKYITHTELVSAEQSQDFTTSQPNQQTLVSLYLESITRIRMIILAQSRSVWFLLPRWSYRTFSSLYQDEERTMEPIRAMARSACQNAHPSSPIGLLSRHPVYAHDNDGTNHSKNLIDEAITLLFAGQDTSAATLSWTLHLLTLYPHVQSMLAQEVCDVANKSTGASCADEIEFTKPMIAQMPFLDAVIKESMRLYPVAPFVVRKLGTGVAIPFAPSGSSDRQTNATSGMLSLPDNALACIWIYSLHRNPLFWSDPDDFRPERWLEGKGNESTGDLGTRAPGAYIPFAAGPRNCIGQALANIVLRTLLAQIVYRYEFRDERIARLSQDERADSKLIASFRKDMQAGFTVLPRGGLDLSVRRRKTIATR
jgi:cytochrome P450